MNMMKRMFLILLAMVLAMTFAFAAAAESTAAEETAAEETTFTDSVAAYVNGQEIMMSSLIVQMNYYLQQLADQGYDTSDTELIYYVANISLEALIEDVLTVNDMTAMGAYDFTDEENAAITETASQAYSQIMTSLESYYRSMTSGMNLSDEEIAAGTKSLAEQYGYTAQSLLEYYTNDAASERYARMLMGDTVITDEEVKAEYEVRVAASKEAYANDINAFEKAVNNNEEVWYMPEGYRSVLQIVILSDAEDKIADTKEKVDEIYARLEKGEDFKALIAEYGEDAAMTEGNLLETGYMVHKDSSIWDAAFVQAVFSDDMQKPGDYAKTVFASDVGVHIVYYLADHESGAAELTAELAEALRSDLYNTRMNEKVQERLETMYAEAEIIVVGQETAESAE